MIRKYPKYITTYDKKLSLTLRIFLLLDNNKHLTYVVVLEDTAGYLTPLWCQIHVLDNFHMFILEQALSPLFLRTILGQLDA